MKIAVIGTGIAGNVVSHHLHKEHDITVFEVNDYVGGHTHTHDVTLGDHNYAVDTGFIVFNYKTYPHFSRLLQELGVEVQPSSMSFSVKCERTGLEYNGTSLNTLFAQRRNLIRPSFYRMISCAFTVKLPIFWIPEERICRSVNYCAGMVTPANS